MATPDTAFVRQYQNTIQHLAQQKDSRLRGTVMVDTNFVGEKKFYEQYNLLDDFVALVQRYQDTPIALPDFRRRMVIPQYFVSNTFRDPADALQMLIDPTSAFMTAKRAGANRKIDDIIITAFNATANTGKDGTGTQAFTAANQIAAGTSGLTKNKILQAKRLLDAAEVDKEDRFFIHTAFQLEDLLKTTEVTSSDYNVVRTLVEGDLKTWIGFAWIHTERLLADSSSNRLCYAYQKMAMQLAIQKDVQGRIDERPDKNYALQVYMRLVMGAARLEESRIIQIACVESES